MISSTIELDLVHQSFRSCRGSPFLKAQTESCCVPGQCCTFLNKKKQFFAVAKALRLGGRRSDYTHSAQILTQHSVFRGIGLNQADKGWQRSSSRNGKRICTVFSSFSSPFFDCVSVCQGPSCPHVVCRTRSDARSRLRQPAAALKTL